MASLFLPRYATKQPQYDSQVNTKLIGGEATAVWVPRGKFGGDLAHKSTITGGDGRNNSINRSGTAWYSDLSIGAHWKLSKGSETSRSITVVWHGIYYAGNGTILRDQTTAGGIIPIWRNAGQYNMRLGGTNYVAAGSWPVGEPVTIVVTGTNNSARLWANGKLMISSGAAPTLTSPVSQWILGRNGLNTEYTTQETNLLAIIPRSVPDAVGIELSINPWKILQRPSSRIYPVSSGGPNSYTITPSGGLSTGGTIGQLHTKVFDVSGGVTFDGTAPIENTSSYVISPTGGFTFDGSVDQPHTRVFSVDGGVDFSGTSDIVYSKTISPAGGVVFGGSSSITNQAQYVLDVSGGMTFDGAIEMVKSKTITPTGGLNFNGSSSLITPDSETSQGQHVFQRQYIGRR